MSVSEEAILKPLDALKKYHFPYCNTNTFLESADYTNAPLLCVHICKEEFIAVYRFTNVNPPTTAMCKYQLDGNSTGLKSLIGDRNITTSPNSNFIVVTEEIGNKIEILDLTTLDVIKEYVSPHDEIQCHVFGDDRCWYIVIKGCYDNKVYVIE
jgi:hypothetical protein